MTGARRKPRRNGGALTVILVAGVAVRQRIEDGVVPLPEPRIIAWSDHALAKAQFLGIARADVEDAILDGHQHRARNTGTADWLLLSGRLAIAYNHPVAGDNLTARVVTLWRRS